MKNKRAGNGGNFYFAPGRGATPKDMLPGFDGSIIFQHANGNEFIRVDPSGAVYVRGELVDTNREIYEGWSAWLHHAKITTSPPTGDGEVPTIVEAK